MPVIEFETELQGGPVLPIPDDIIGQLPSSGSVRVVVFVEDSEDDDWRKFSYEQFMRDDNPEDAVYDNYP